MRLPVKIVPHTKQQVFGLVAAVITTMGSGAAMLDSLTSVVQKSGHGFTSSVAISILVFLTGLGWATTAAINLLGQSPFEHLIVDRQGITRCSFFGKRRFSWKELGPVQSIRAGFFFRLRGNELKYWIAADARGAVEGEATGLWALVGWTRLRIPAALYLNSGWLFGSMALSSNEAANWLESLRQLARMDRLEEEDIPELPESFAAPIPLFDAPPAESPRADARPSKTMAPPAQPAVRRYGRRRESTVER